MIPSGRILIGDKRSVLPRQNEERSRAAAGKSLLTGWLATLQEGDGARTVGATSPESSGTDRTEQTT
jgi:hypothetical protein